MKFGNNLVWVLVAGLGAACVPSGDGGSGVAPGDPCVAGQGVDEVCLGTQKLECKGEVGAPVWEVDKDCAATGEVCSLGNCVPPGEAAAGGGAVAGDPCSVGEQEVCSGTLKLECKGEVGATVWAADKDCAATGAVCRAGGCEPPTGEGGGDAPAGIVGFWANAPVDCGPAAGLAYGLALCGSGRLNGLASLTAEGYLLKWLWDGGYTTSGDPPVADLNFDMIVVEPAEGRGERSGARVQLAYDPGTDELTFVGADGAFLCEGLTLQRVDTVTDADCEDVEVGGGGGGGCTADVDCGEGRRCERTTGRCLTRL